MLIAVATRTGHSVNVFIPSPRADEEEETHSEVPPKDGPSPIAPEMKELAWSAGAFILFAVLMRFVLYPRLKKGMEARYASIRAGHEGADAERAAARAEVAEYETQLASLKAQANERVEAARRTLEDERAQRLAVVNAGISERRQAALAEADEARAAIRGDLESAVGDVVNRTVELATGRAPSSDAVASAVSTAMVQGASR